MIFLWKIFAYRLYLYIGKVEFEYFYAISKQCILFLFLIIFTLYFIYIFEHFTI